MLKCYAVPEVSEDCASGPLRELYEDIKLVLKVPVINSVFRTLACYDRFLFLAWNQIRPSLLTLNFEEAAETLRHFNISVVNPITDWHIYYSDIQINIIINIIRSFNYANAKLLLMVCAWAESLSERPIYGAGNNKGRIKPGVIPEFPDIKLIEFNETPLNIKELYEDIAKTCCEFSIASDFRVLANYPSFLIESWKGLRPYVNSQEYRELKSGIKSKAVELIHSMPFAVTIDKEILEKLYTPKDIAAIIGFISMFQDTLPGLIINGEFFKKIIEKTE